MISTNSNNVYQYLTKVINSKTFEKSVVSNQLLKYLVTQSLNGETPKEFQIAFDLFGERAKDEKEKNIRVYVHNLRKKLIEYYKNEGSNDEIRFEIPKGHYAIKFNVNKKIYVRNKLNKFSPFILGLSLILFIASGFIFLKEKKLPLQKCFIWKDFWESDYPTKIILGDHYFFRYKVEFGRHTIMRWHEINSDEDLTKMMDSDPELEDKISRLDYAYINKQVPYGLFMVMKNLVKSNSNITLSYSSKTDWNDIKGCNVIYISSLKTKCFLNEFHKDVGIEYDYVNLNLKYHLKDSTIILNPESINEHHTEYSSIVYFKTDDGRSIASFICGQDIGNKAVLDYLSDVDNLDYLKEKAKENGSDNFKAVFEVKGYGQTDFVIHPLRVDPIEVDIDELWP